MFLDVLSIGMLATNCYIVAAERHAPALVIDPAGEVKRIISRLREAELECAGILCTHGHADHVAGAGALSEALDLPVHIHEADAAGLAGPRVKLMGLAGGVLATRARQLRYLEDGERIEAGELSLLALHTPGHTPGGMSFFTPGYLFCGDLIFQGSIGRTDLRGGSLRGLLRAVGERIWDLPDETRILPGHGPQTTLGRERRENPFLQGLGAKRRD